MITRWLIACIGPVQRGQRARVRTVDGAEQDGVGEGRAECEHDRDDVHGEDDFVEGDGHEHGRILLIWAAHVPPSGTAHARSRSRAACGPAPSAHAPMAEACMHAQDRPHADRSP